MERLTEKRDGHNVIPLRQDGKREWALCPDYQGDAPVKYLYGDHADRLAAYEDTGLEPEEVNAVKHSLMGKSIAEIKEFEGIPIQRLRELAKAEEDGLIPPCKRGDVVYCIRHNPCTGYRVKPLNVCTVTVWGPGHFTIFTTKEDTLGKTVFLTREEAEAALPESEGTE